MNPCRISLLLCFGSGVKFGPVCVYIYACTLISIIVCWLWFVTAIHPNLTISRSIQSMIRSSRVLLSVFITRSWLSYMYQAIQHCIVPSSIVFGFFLADPSFDPCRILLYFYIDLFVNTWQKTPVKIVVEVQPNCTLHQIKHAPE